MYFIRDLLPTILALALSATGAEGAIAIGIGARGLYNAMWVDGTNPCRFTRINDVGENPCNVLSTRLDGNGFRYSLQGCGGALWLNNEDGSFNSNCRAARANLDCGVRRDYICS
ncbi:hypothetical protein GGI35DRAFT_460757 [Trichoderma velutinum]